MTPDLRTDIAPWGGGAECTDRRLLPVLPAWEACSPWGEHFTHLGRAFA
jgi:hypothetical protein